MDIMRERPRHAAAIEDLVVDCFGEGRFGKTVYRLRDGVRPNNELGLVALEDGELVGTLRFWPIHVDGIGETILLGPLAVAEGLRSSGIGSRLMRAGLSRAAAFGYRSVILVGDEPYYRRFGFRRDLTLGLMLPGPVDYDRLLGLELVPGALANARGMIGRADGIPVRYEMAESAAA